MELPSLCNDTCFNVDVSPGSLSCSVQGRTGWWGETIDYRIGGRGVDLPCALGALAIEGVTAQTVLPDGLMSALNFDEVIQRQLEQ